HRDVALQKPHVASRILEHLVRRDRPPNPSARLQPHQTARRSRCCKNSRLGDDSPTGHAMNALAAMQPVIQRNPFPSKRTWLRWAGLILFPAIAFAFCGQMSPWTFMWALSIALFFGCKCETFIRAKSSGIDASQAKSLAYLFLWPGMDAKAFLAAPATTE